MELRGSNKDISRSVPEVHPLSGQRGSKGLSPTPSSLKAVEGLKKVAGKSAETYTAYGATEILYKECALQASYTIDRAEDADPPKTKDGEDLGIGEGWWNNGS